jgi:hypothetical protein
LLEPAGGPRRWTLELLADELVRLTAHKGVSRETVRRRLAENDLKPWRRDMWCIPQVDANYVARIDNLSTHSAGALYQTFPADEARRVLRRLEFHYVPKHASWLN